MTEEGATLLRRLDEALERLSANAADQEGYLRSLGMGNADELALDLEDVRSAATPVLEREERGGDVIERVETLDRELDAMSGPDRANLWTFAALHSSPQWEKVRQLASDARHALRDRSS